MCGKGQESVAHVLAGRSAIAQTKYLERHNSVLRILFFEILTKYNLLPREEYTWYKRISPKPVYENEELKALWDVPLFAEKVEVRANRIDAQVIDKVKKEVILIEMSRPWMENRQMKMEESIVHSDGNSSCNIQDIKFLSTTSSWMYLVVIQKM